MKVLKKALKTQLALLLALLLTLALGTTAFAAESYSITVKNTNPSISMAGNTYKAYKLFNVTYSGDNYAYTVTEEFKYFEYSYSTTNDEGETTTKTVSGEALINYLATLSSNAEALDTFAEAALKYATDNEIIAAGTVAANEGANEATISVLSAGYYLVAGSASAAADKTQTVVAACALTTTHPTATVNVKADAPSIEKKIVEGEKKVDANTASIGDTVNYEISSKVPDMKGYEKYFFVMNDTLSKGLTYNDDESMKVTIGDKELTKYDDTTKIGDYTVESITNANGKTTITIVFKNFIQYKEQAGTAITVTYSATLNQNADLSANEGNPNTVTLTYSNNPNEQGEGTPENPDKPGDGDATGTTPKSEVKTYVTGIKINKVDGTDSTKKLAGAKFSIRGTAQKVVITNKEMYKASENGIYYMLKDGSYTTSPAVTDKTVENYNADKYDSTTQKYEKVTVVNKDTETEKINAVGYTDANGILTFEGLNAGTYTITELVAPDGYNLLKDSITVTITENANIQNANWTVTEKVGDTESNLQAGADNLFSINVINNSGSELPSTGGMGTTIFYVLGSLLVVIAGVALVTKKRMSKTEE